MDQETLYSTALEICGLSNEEVLQLLEDERPGAHSLRSDSKDVWRILADHYLKMQIVADQISMLTRYDDTDLADIPVDAQASRFQPGSATRIHVMSILIALGMRDLNKDFSNGGATE
ncbi:hypothetical protein AAFN47_02420 [Hoeflea sp. CAU 1731]